MITEDQNRHIWNLIQKTPVAMMVSRNGAGKFHSRPMAVAQNEFDGRLYFFTDAHSGKINELMEHPEVLLDFSNPSKNTFLAVYGTASITQNRHKIDQQWPHMSQSWSPSARTSDKVCLIEVGVESAEYWDSSQNMMIKIYSIVRSAIGAAKGPEMTNHGHLQA